MEVALEQWTEQGETLSVGFTGFFPRYREINIRHIAGFAAGGFVLAERKGFL